MSKPKISYDVAKAKGTVGDEEIDGIFAVIIVGENVHLLAHGSPKEIVSAIINIAETDEDVRSWLETAVEALKEPDKDINKIFEGASTEIAEA